MSGSEGALLSLRLGEWIILLVVVCAAPLACRRGGRPPVGPRTSRPPRASRSKLSPSAKLREAPYGRVLETVALLETVAALV